MKKNEMNPLFVYLFVGIAFIFMTVMVVFLQNNLVTIACLFFLMLAFLLLFYFQKKSYQKTEIVAERKHDKSLKKR